MKDLKICISLDSRSWFCSNRQRNFFTPSQLLNLLLWSDPIVFITVLIEFCFRAPRCRSICNTLTVISFLSSTQRNHPWWNFNQPSGILLQTCLSSSSPMEPQCNPTSTHCEIMATPQPPTPIRVNKTWHALFCFRDNFYIFPALHNWGPCLKFRRLRVSLWREWSQLWTDEPGCWLKMKITSERAGIMSIPTIGFERGQNWGEIPQSAVRSATSQSPYPAPTVLWALPPQIAVAQIRYYMFACFC